MKNNILVLSILFCVFSIPNYMFGQQVIIGSKQQFVSKSSILEFPDNDTRGIVLPKVNSDILTNAVGGTLIFDTKDKKVKYTVENNQWIDLSVNAGVVNTTRQDNLKELDGARTLIGNDPSIVATGVLVLDSTTQAMILPRVASPHLNMISPPTGIIVYDTVSNMICVFNGNEWAFWASE